MLNSTYVLQNKNVSSSGMIDDSGLRLWMTETLRPQEAGLLQVGMQVWPAHQIPPNYKKFVNHGHCHSLCTEKVTILKYECGVVEVMRCVCVSVCMCVRAVERLNINR